MYLLITQIIPTHKKLTKVQKQKLVWFSIIDLHINLDRPVLPRAFINKFYKSHYQIDNEQKIKLPQYTVKEENWILSFSRTFRVEISCF